MQTDVISPEVVRSANFVADAAALILKCGRQAIAERGLFRLALSGGSTPAAVHAEIVRTAGDFPWQKVQLTFGDERCVPPDDKDSNYRMAKESLLDPLAIPEANVFRMRGEIAPDAAAAEYEAKLAAFAARFGEPRYVHDLLLLGIGEDGHTASLFPGSPALTETQRNVIPATGPKPPPQRITMTFPLLNAARHVCFLTKATGKEQVIEQVLAGDQRYPSAHVKPASGRVTWVIGI